MSAYDFNHKVDGNIRDKTVVPVSRYPDGAFTRFCKQCGEFSAAKERVRGEQYGSAAGEVFVIHVDYIVGTRVENGKELCGHVVRDYSY